MASWLDRLRSMFETDSRVIEHLSAQSVSVSGLAKARFGELVRFESGEIGRVTSLFDDHVEVELLDPGTPGVGTTVVLAGFPTIPVGPTVFGNVIDPLGRGAPSQTRRRIGVSAPSFRQRQPMEKQCFETGIKAIDILIPIQPGETRILVGPPGSGKTSLALQIVRHRGSLGQQSVLVSAGQSQPPESLMASLGEARHACTLVSAASNPRPAIRHLALEAGAAIAAQARDDGGEACLIVDSLNRVLESTQQRTRNAGLTQHLPTAWRQLASVCEHATRLAKPAGSLTILLILESEVNRTCSHNALFKAGKHLPGVMNHQIQLSRLLALEGRWPTIDFTAYKPLTGSWFPHLRGFGYKLLLHCYDLEFERNLGGIYPPEEELEGPNVVPQSLTWCRQFQHLLEQSRSETIPLGMQVALFSVAWKGHLKGLEPESIPTFVHHFMELLGSEPDLLEAIGATGVRENEAQLRQLALLSRSRCERPE